MAKKYKYNKRTGKIEEKEATPIRKIILAIMLVVLICAIVIWGIIEFSSSDQQVNETYVEPVIEEVDNSLAVEEESLKVEKDIPPFIFETYRYFRNSEDAEIELKADFPMGESVVNDSIRLYIHELFGGQYRCNLQGAQAILNYYGDKDFRDYEKEHQEAVENLESSENNEEGTSYRISAFKSWKYFKVEYVDEKYVTYKVESYFWTGGIHELGGEHGVTFSRSSGKQINYSYFRNLESDSFKNIIKAGLKRYFQNSDWAASTDEDLAECLQNVENVNDIPLPGADPYFTPEGVCFEYCSYEIASYAAGFPSFILPYNDAKPYMSEDAWNLISITK